jgi:NlpC/P60 family putative phage cell wall peptidase
MTTREQIVAEAQTWLGTKYHHMAAVKGHGVDCAQILIEVYHSVGLADRPDVGYYPSDWMLHRSEERYLGWIEKYCRQIPQEDAKDGDIVLFKFGRCFSHSGIIADYPRIIHAQSEDNCCYAKIGMGNLDGKEMRFYSFFGGEK